MVYAIIVVVAVVVVLLLLKKIRWSNGFPKSFDNRDFCKIEELYYNAFLIWQKRTKEGKSGKNLNENSQLRNWINSKIRNQFNSYNFITLSFKSHIMNQKLYFLFGIKPIWHIQFTLGCLHFLRSIAFFIKLPKYNGVFVGIRIVWGSIL